MPKRLRLPFLVLLFGFLLVEDGRIRDLLDHHPPQIEFLMAAFTQIGAFPHLLAIPVVLWFSGLLSRTQRLKDAGLFGCIGLILARAGSGLIKHLLGRGRPDMMEGDPYEFAGPTFDPDYSSFPSGHAASSFALAFIIGEFYPRWRWTCYVIAFLIAYSRIYLDRHFASDVYAGAALGMWMGWIMTRKCVRT